MGRILLTLVFALGMGLIPVRAQAGVFYFEFGAGPSRFTTNQGYFGSGFSTGSEFGVGINNGLFYSFGSGSKPIELHFGVADRLVEIRESGASYAFFGVYPTVRLQLSRVWFGAGYSPLTLVRMQETGGLDNFKEPTNGNALCFDAGVLFPITPFFSVGGSGAVQTFTGGGATAGAFDIGFFLRFYMGFITGEKRNSGEFKGWRYPFGRELWN